MASKPWERSQPHATAREIRDAVAFVERLTIYKTNGRNRIEAFGGGLSRRPRESFVNYCLRVRAGFPASHHLPTVRLRQSR